MISSSLGGSALAPQQHTEQRGVTQTMASPPNQSGLSAMTPMPQSGMSSSMNVPTVYAPQGTGGHGQNAARYAQQGFNPSRPEPVADYLRWNPETAAASSSLLQMNPEQVGALFGQTQNQAEKAALYRQFAAQGDTSPGGQAARQWLIQNEFGGDKHAMNHFINYWNEANVGKMPIFDAGSGTFHYMDDRWDWDQASSKAGKQFEDFWKGGADPSMREAQRSRQLAGYTPYTGGPSAAGASGSIAAGGGVIPTTGGAGRDSAYYGQGVQGNGQVGAFGGQSYMGQSAGANPQWARGPQSVGGFNTPGYQYGMEPSGQIQTRGIDNSGQYNTGQIDPAQMPVSGVAPGQQYLSNMQDAYYKQAASRLDPQWNQRQADLENQLANMGLPRGSEAWNREMENLSRSRNDAYGSAMNQAIMNSGQEAARMMGMDINAGNFANQAAQQNFSNQGTAQQLRNQALTQQQGANLAAGQFGNQAQQQGFNQQQIRAQLNNQALAQQVQDQLALGNLGMNYTLGMTGHANTARQISNAEALQNYNMLNDMRMRPIIEQNALIQGMYPTGMPGYGSVPIASPYGAGYSQAGYSGLIQDANRLGNAGTSNLIGAGMSLGGQLLQPQPVNPGASLGITFP